MAAERSTILNAKNLCLQGNTPALSCSFHNGTLTLLTGEKDLLLRVLGLLERPLSGELFFKQVSTTMLSDEDRILLRNQRFGFIFSDPFLLPAFSVVENVAMPLLKVFGTPAKEAREKTEASLHLVGIPELGEQPVSALTAFDQMRVALARALAHRPAVVVVDSPEVNFASEELLLFCEILRRPCNEWGATVLLGSDAPHPLADRIVRLTSNELTVQ